MRNTVNIRDGLHRSGVKLKRDPCAIAYFGASNGFIRNGWRSQVHTKLNETFAHGIPHREINCCLGGIGSLIGGFLAKQRLPGAKPDLAFVEFSHTDLWLGGTQEMVAHSIEALVRIIKSHNPDCEICFLYYHSLGTEDHRLGRLSPVEQVYERIADHYGIPSINVGKYMEELAQSGEMSLSGETGAPPLFRRDTVHLTIDGNKKIAAFLGEALLELLDVEEEHSAIERTPAPIIAQNIDDWRSYDVTAEMIAGPFTRIKKTSRVIDFENTGAAVDCFSLQPGAKLSFKIRGHLAGICLVLGPNSGVIRYTSGDKVIVRELFDNYCNVDRIAVYAPYPEFDLSKPPTTQNVVIELADSLPSAQRSADMVPILPPSEWTLDVIRLFVIGSLVTGNSQPVRNHG